MYIRRKGKRKQESIQWAVFKCSVNGFADLGLQVADDETSL